MVDQGFLISRFKTSLEPEHRRPGKTVANDPGEILIRWRHSTESRAALECSEREVARLKTQAPGLRPVAQASLSVTVSAEVGVDFPPAFANAFLRPNHLRLQRGGKTQSQNPSSLAHRQMLQQPVATDPASSIGTLPPPGPATTLTAMRWFSLALAALVTACGSGDLLPACKGGLALLQVTVIDGLGNPPVSDQGVLICEGRIAGLGPAASLQIPRGARKVEMPGRFVMPGLIDMHAHVTVLPLDEQNHLVSRMHRADSEQALRTLLAFGVTTVRNPAGPAADAVALRESVASGKVLGPRIKTAGDALNPRHSFFGPFVAVPDEVAMRAEVERQAGLGVDYIKLYSELPPELIRVGVEAAHALGLEVIAHLQRTDWTEGARLGVDHITHGAPWSNSYLPDAAREGYRGRIKDRMTWLEEVDFDGPAITEMITVLAEEGVSVDPTLIAYRTKFFGDEPRHRDHPEMHLAPSTARQAWERATFTDDWTADDYARGHQVWPRMLELTRRLHEGGVMLTVGTDFPSPWVIPGVSFHEELGLLAEAGIPTLEILKMATYNGAVALGLDKEIGSVEVGKRADLLVLTGNPAIHLRNTRAIYLVLLGGEGLKPSALLAALDSAG
jgi:imidazolonepropionase-like amidohydrolase